MAPVDSAVGRKRCVPLYLCSVQVDIPKADQSVFSTKGEYLGEDGFHQFFMAGSEASYGAVIGNRIGGQPSIRQFILASLDNLARGAPVLAIGIDQNTKHDSRIVRGPTLTCVGLGKKSNLHLLNDIVDDPDYMLFGEPLVHRWGKEQQLLAISRDESAPHAVHSNHA